MDFNATRISPSVNSNRSSITLTWHEIISGRRSDVATIFPDTPIRIWIPHYQANHNSTCKFNTKFSFFKPHNWAVRFNFRFNMDILQLFFLAHIVRVEVERKPKWQLKKKHISSWVSETLTCISSYSFSAPKRQVWTSYKKRIFSQADFITPCKGCTGSISPSK